MKYGLTRDPEYVGKHIIEKNGTFYCTKKCKIEFPTWYFEKEMGEISEDVNFYGIFIIIIDDKYAVSTITTICRSNPINIGSIDRDGVDYTQLEFGVDDPILTTKQVVQETLLSYNYIDRFVVRSNTPWFVEYEDNVRFMNNLYEYGKSNVGAQPLANELIPSFITRDKRNPDLFYRQTNMKNDYMYINLLSPYYGIRSTVGRISGGFLQEGIVGSLVKSDKDEASDLDIHLG